MKSLELLKPYNKFLIALLGEVLTVVVQFYGDNELVQVILPILTAFGVYQVPNKK